MDLVKPTREMWIAMKLGECSAILDVLVCHMESTDFQKDADLVIKMHTAKVHVQKAFDCMNQLYEDAPE